MKVIIAGGRDLFEPEAVKEAVQESGFEITEAISGGADGIDLVGELWAGSNGKPIARFPADWNQHGRAAGPIRNKQMAEYADALILVWDGQSRGSASMKVEAIKAGLRIYEKIV